MTTTQPLSPPSLPTDLWGSAFAEPDNDCPPATVRAVAAAAIKAAEKRPAKTYEDFDFDDLQVYAGLDCIGTTELLSRLFPVIAREDTFYVPDEHGNKVKSKAPATLDSIVNIEMVAHEFIVDLEINGIKYDVERNASIDKQMRTEIDELERMIKDATGLKPDQLDSGQQVVEYLYGVRKFEAPSTTKSGEPAVDGNALMTLAGLPPLGGKYKAADPALQFLADMAKRKDISSVHNTFIRTYVQDWVKRTGRIHPSYNLHGTSSFRITGTNPNLTQLPRSKHGYNVRVCYTVDPGYVFISFDFSSAEVKVLANLAKEPAMLQAIADGLDFHTFSAAAMNGIPYEVMNGVLGDQKHPDYKHYKNLRQIAKTSTKFRRPRTAMYV
jgi:hypothetical protein